MVTPDSDKPIIGKNLIKMLDKNPALHGVEIQIIRIANQQQVQMYREKLAKRRKVYNYGAYDKMSDKMFVLDKDGDVLIAEGEA